VTLLAFAADRRAAADVDRRRPRLMQTHRAAEIDIACLWGPQQQTH